MMTIGTEGLNLIKSFEGCRLTAYKCVSTEQYHTIGYGHYGPDVKAGMKISQAQAEAYLKADLSKFEGYVNAIGLALNQNQFDALVSFTYNCGNGNLKSLIRNRSLDQIADALLLYNKSGGKVLAGLTRRRTAERSLFISAATGNTKATTSEAYEPGTYILTAKLKVRAGTGTKYAQRKKKELTADAQRVCDAAGCLPVGTRVTVSKIVQSGSDYWAQIPSGYVCIKLGNSTYMKKA